MIYEGMWYLVVSLLDFSNAVLEVGGLVRSSGFLLIFIIVGAGHGHFAEHRHFLVHVVEFDFILAN